MHERATHSGAHPGPRVLVLAADDLLALGVCRLLMRAGIDARSGRGFAFGDHDVLIAEPGPEGLPGAAARAMEAGCPVIALCGDDDGAVAALASGASAALGKAAEPAALVAAVEAVAAGQMLLEAGLGRRVMAAARRRCSAASECSCRSLTARERDVVRLLARGLENTEIARELVVTASTVKNHVANAMEKLGARNRTHAAVLVTERGCALA